MLPLADLPPGWTVGQVGQTGTSRPSTPTTSTRRSTAAPRASSSTASRAWRTPSTTRPATRRTRSSSTSSRWPTPLKALGKYGSEKPDEAKVIPVGTEGYTAAGSTLFYAGKYYTQIVSTQDDPKFAAFALELAKRVAAKQKPGGGAPTTAAAPRRRPRRPPSRAKPAPAEAKAAAKPAAAEITPETYFGFLPAGRQAGRQQVRRPGRLRLQLPVRRLHGRLQGGRSHLAGLPPPLSRRQGGQGGAREVRRRRQAGRGRDQDAHGRGGRRDGRLLEHRPDRRRLPQGQHPGRRQRRHRAQAGRGLRPGAGQEPAGAAPSRSAAGSSSRRVTSAQTFAATIDSRTRHRRFVA